eukprot:scaffold33572_cov122-Isochrysis_galbana.AAC.1
MMMWFLSPRPCAFLALLPFVLVRCARFRDGELNPTSIKEVGLSCGGSNNQPLVNDVMIDSLTDSALIKGRERSAPGMSHADTHTPLHGPTGGVPSDKALSQGLSININLV